MMTFKIQIIIGICLIAALVLIINMIRKRSLDLKYALSWMAALFMVLILDCFPTLLTRLAQALGIFAPVNMIFFLGFCFALVIIFTLTVIVSRTSERVRKLAQTIALQEEKIAMLTRKMEGNAIAKETTGDRNSKENTESYEGKNQQ